MDPATQRPKKPAISGYFEIQAKANVVFFQILAKAMLLVISAFKEIPVLSDISLWLLFIYIAGNSNNFRYNSVCPSLSPGLIRAGMHKRLSNNWLGKVPTLHVFWNKLGRNLRRHKSRFLGINVVYFTQFQLCCHPPYYCERDCTVLLTRALTTSKLSLNSCYELDTGRLGLKGKEEELQNRVSLFLFYLLFGYFLFVCFSFVLFLLFWGNYNWGRRLAPGWFSISINMWESLIPGYLTGRMRADGCVDHAGTQEVILIRTTQRNEHCPSYSSEKRVRPLSERILETVYKESNSFLSKSQNRDSYRTT